MKTKCLLPEPLAMMESTRAIGYSTETAVADILDNSLAAGAENIDIFYMPASNEQNAYVAIIDDGVGRNGDEIDTAMRYGGRSPLEDRAKNDLGRFGLGLKTASLSPSTLHSLRRRMSAAKYQANRRTVILQYSTPSMDSNFPFCQYRSLCSIIYKLSKSPEE